MPTSATNIQESHNLDINVSWMRFSAPLEDIEEMTTSLISVEQTQVDFLRPRRREVRSWWLKDLHEQSDTQKPYRFFRYDDHYQMGGEKQLLVEFLAVDFESGMVWYWMP